MTRTLNLNLALGQEKKLYKKILLESINSEVFTLDFKPLDYELILYTLLCQSTPLILFLIKKSKLNALSNNLFF